MPRAGETDEDGCTYEIGFMKLVSARCLVYWGSSPDGGRDTTTTTTTKITDPIVLFLGTF